MPRKPRQIAVTRVIELDAHEQADIARMRMGVPPPEQLLCKLIEIVSAALHGNRIAVKRVTVPHQRGATPRARLPASSTFEHEGVTVVLPPARLADLPGGWIIGRYGCGAALRRGDADAGMAFFLHDLHPEDLAAVMAQERQQAEVYLGTEYARRALWWEAKS